MSRHTIASLALVATVAACNRETPNLQAEQRAEQTQLARDQTGERRELAQDQAAERAAAQREASGTLAERTDKVEEERAELNTANAELAQAAALACTGVQAPDACPVRNASIASIDEISDGVKLTLVASAVTRDQLTRDIACYRARSALRSTPVDGACIVDLAGKDVNVDVLDTDGRVQVTLVSEDDNWMTRLRDAARRTLADLDRRRTAVSN